MTLRRIAVAGNPNVGKTSLFNLLTGSRYDVGNYPGMTVEQREGRLLVGGEASTNVLIDLPGTYSLSAVSEDEAVAFRALSGEDESAPDAILLVLDASNLARNLYFALQVLELGRPTLLALNMVDAARDAGVSVDAAALSEALGVDVVETVARSGQGVRGCTDALLKLEGGGDAQLVALDDAAASSSTELLAALEAVGCSPAKARWLVASAAADRLDLTSVRPPEAEVLAKVSARVRHTAAEDIIAARYARVDALLEKLGIADAVRDGAPTMSASNRVDALLTHPVVGLAAFVSIMALVFVSIFFWADPLMGGIESAIGWLSETVAGWMGPGLFTDLVTEGVIAGVGNVLVFVPQIALLFLFIGLLEDSGYLARAAFLLDRLMSRLGLHGRAFIPLLSGYACAIPAIMGTRTISSYKDRLVTMLMIPYMSCSARLPIYALVIGALFVGGDPWISESVDQGLLLLGMYALSTLSALGAGFIYKRTVLKSPTPPLVLELPPYRVPRLANTTKVVFDRTKDFIKSAGTVILAFTIVLWAVLSFPRDATGAGQGGPTQISKSYGGRVAQSLEPALEPIGQDWRVGIGIIGSFAAREVLVSTLGLAYGMEADDDDPVELRAAIRNDTDPETGEPTHSRLSGLALMVFFVYACQCMSTVAVVRRETRGWRWPLFMFTSMTGIAYIAALIVFQVGLLLGAG